MSANAYIKSSALTSDGRAWEVWINGRLVEDGLITKEAAFAAFDWWQRNYREEEAPAPARNSFGTIGGCERHNLVACDRCQAARS